MAPGIGSNGLPGQVEGLSPENLPGVSGDDMKRVIVDHFGGPEVLRVVEDGDPPLSPGEVRVRVLAAGVSFTDAQLRAGTYLGVPKPPFTPGYELVGVVEELGPRSSRLQVGDRVAALTAYGGYADYVSCRRRRRRRCPKSSIPRRLWASS